MSLYAHRHEPTRRDRKRQNYAFIGDLVLPKRQGGTEKGHPVAVRIAVKPVLGNATFLGP